MGFRRGRPTHRNNGHKWSNDPDMQHRKCVTCGCRIEMHIRNSGNVEYTYFDKNGNIVDELPKCKSIYDLLESED